MTLICIVLTFTRSIPFCAVTAEVDESLTVKFGGINSAIQAFVSELKVLGLWNNTTVVQFSDFSRTLNPNTGDGSDHGWYVSMLLVLSFQATFLLILQVILAPSGEVITSCSEEQ